MDSLVGDFMGKKLRWIQKNYPVIVMILVHVVGGILWFYGNFVSQQEWKYIKKIVENLFYGSALLCIIVTIFVVIKFKRLSYNADISYEEYLKYSYEIKCGHNEIHKALLFFGILLLVPVFTSLSSLHMLLQGTTMLLQSGYISTIGIKKMYKAGKFDETSMTGYVLSQYVPFRDKKVLMELMKREINVQ